jgi:hypothetical protein
MSFVNQIEKIRAQSSPPSPPTPPMPTGIEKHIGFLGLYTLGGVDGGNGKSQFQSPIKYG